MSNDIQLFVFEKNEIRTIVIDDVVYFVGKDVANCLGYANSRKAIADHVYDEDKVVTKCDTLGGMQDMIAINESGLYSLILSSKIPSAKKFKKWVTNEVLPTIRTKGYYAMPQTFSEALRLLADAEEEKERLMIENNDLKHKAVFYDTVANSNDLMSIGDAAKLINVGIGRNILFKFLRSKKILMHNNVPYQKYVERGYFKLVESKFSKPNGDIGVNVKTMVTQKGLKYIINIFKKKEN